MLVATNSNAIPYGSLTVGGGGTFVFDPSASAGPSTALEIAALPSVAVAAVPEPGTIALLAAAIWSAAITPLSAAAHRRLGRREGKEDSGKENKGRKHNPKPKKL